MNTALVILAAGIGSRFGKGIKQIEPVGPHGELIIDYSVNDAVEAGFNKIVCIIRHDIEDDFKKMIGNRLSEKIKVEYAFQEMDKLPSGFSADGRTKPWGTGHALLCCKGIVNENFAIINADDYYGKEAFVKIHDYLENMPQDSTMYHFAMAGFKLKNTLSENGGVTRGVCNVSENGMLTGVTETSNIEKIDGKPAVKGDCEVKYLDNEAFVSMNMWGLTPDFINELSGGFEDFLKKLEPDDKKSEYLLPDVIDSMIKSNKADVKVLPVNDRWFGVTYQEDKYYVRDEFKKLHNQGIYDNVL